MNVGKCEWFIPDAFYPEKDNGDYVSHEAVCVLNTGKTEARIVFRCISKIGRQWRIFCGLPGQSARTMCAWIGFVPKRRRHSQRRPICDLRKEQRACRRTVQPVRYDAALELAFMGLLAY